jgi:protein-S-isoprenylcysteine O-methyltransferase Ste14
VKTLAAQAILGLAQLVVALGITLFVPAWTFDYWQAWVCICVFVAPSALITAYLWKNDQTLLASRVKAGSQAESEPLQKRIQFFAALAFIGIFVLSSLDHRFSWSRVPLPFVVAGDALILLGFFIVFRVFVENTFTAATIQVVAGQRVVSTGPYAFVRHPMYAGALVMLFGIPFALGSAWGLLMLVPMIIILVQRLLDEEKFLSQSLPGYKEYCHKIHYHLVPLIW